MRVRGGEGRKKEREPLAMAASGFSREESLGSSVPRTGVCGQPFPFTGNLSARDPNPRGDWRSGILPRRQQHTKVPLKYITLVD